ncbi:MAG: elongation factor 1-alpha C-terminal domain-related protein, partial [Trebonia sp.]
VMHLPSGFITHVTGIDTVNGPVQEAFPPMSVVLRVDDDIDISRGDMICRPNNRPRAAQDIEAMVCWMADDRPLAPGDRFLVKHTTRVVRAMVEDLVYRLHINSLHRDDGSASLKLNEIGKVRIRTTQPLFADDYQRNRLTGGFIFIDEMTNGTVGAGMITATKNHP